MWDFFSTVMHWLPRGSDQAHPHINQTTSTSACSQLLKPRENVWVLAQYRFCTSTSWGILKNGSRRLTMTNMSVTMPRLMRWLMPSLPIYHCTFRFAA